MQRRVAAIPLSGYNPAHLASNELTGRAFLFAAYVVYALSSATVLRDVVPDECKHVVFLLGAVWSLLLNPKRSVGAAVLTLPLAAIYVIGGLPMYGAMVVTLSLSLPLFWRGISSVISRRDYRFVFMLLGISLIPAVLSLPAMMVEGPFSMTYGRPRLLMGYFHPKEAAVSFAVPMLLAMRMNRRAHHFIWLLAFVFLWEVGSRNTALSIALVWALRWHIRLSFAALIVMLPVTVFWIALAPDWFDKLNTLFSLRLTVWEDVIRYGREFANAMPSLDDRFGADNFFVEAFVLAGPFATMLILWCMAQVVAVVRLKSGTRMPLWPLIGLIVLLFNASFDTGIASTGNLMHAFLWATLLAPVFRRGQAQGTAPVSGAVSAA